MVLPSSARSSKPRQHLSIIDNTWQRGASDQAGNTVIKWCDEQIWFILGYGLRTALAS